MIKVEGLTKQFSSTKGIFGLNLTVNEGEVLGFIGPNGAGKSTTIRHLLGFLRPDEGQAMIDNFNCWSEPIEAKRSLGFVPGEIAFPSGVAAGTFLDLLSEIRKNAVQPLRNDLVRRFQLDLSTPIKAMSKGTKQKLALVAAFMGDPAVLILDEPSSGLDPLMQDTLISLLEEEKKKGKTILLSSHIFEEVEAVADSITVIREGHLVASQSMSTLENELSRTLRAWFDHPVDPAAFTVGATVVSATELDFPLDGDIAPLLGELSQSGVKKIETRRVELREYFRDAYGGKQS